MNFGTLKESTFCDDNVLVSTVMYTVMILIAQYIIQGFA